MKSIVIRINLADWRRLRRIMRAYPDESAAHYLERLSNKIEEWKAAYSRGEFPLFTP